MFHDEVKSSVLFPQGKDANDVGVSERSGDLHLLEKLLGEGNIFAEIGSQNLEGDLAI